MASTSNGITKTTREKFETVFPSLVEDLIQRCKQYNMPQDALDWFKKVGYNDFPAPAYHIDTQNSHSP
jgi:hypothetical protein